MKVDLKMDAVQKSLSLLRNQGNVCLLQGTKMVSFSLHHEEGKRFRLVSEQRKTEEGDFRF